MKRVADRAGGWALSLLRNSGMVAVFFILFAALSLLVPFFLTVPNLIGLLLSVSMVGMGACTMLFCLASGEIDISIESTVALSGVLAAVLINLTGSVALGVLGGAAAGGLVGLVNGLVVAKLRINSLIATLAVMQVVRGLCFIISRGSAVGVSTPEFFAIGNGYFLGVPAPVWITALCFLAFAVVFKRTAFGRNTLAVGGNREAARQAGIRVDAVKIAIFSIQGTLMGVAGVVLASRMTSGQPNTSSGYSLDVVSACVLGGVSLSGGSGSVSGALVGVLIMGTVQNAMGLLNMPTFYQYVTRGLILLFAVVYDRLRSMRKAGEA
jgi:L-arabinose transport system permease protein